MGSLKGKTVYMLLVSASLVICFGVLVMLPSFLGIKYSRIRPVLTDYMLSVSASRVISFEVLVCCLYF
jgi:hypothetical protein